MAGLLEASERNKRAYDRFLQLWNNERYSPIVLPREQEVLDTVKEYLSKSQDRIAMYDKVHRDMVHLHMERLRFIFEDYVRLRLSKLSDKPFLYMQTELQKYLTENEQDAARAFLELSHQLLNTTIFQPIKAILSNHATELDPEASFQKELRETLSRQLILLRSKVVVVRFLQATTITSFDTETVVAIDDQLAVHFDAVEDHVIKGSAVLVG
ncbi:Hypothetical protein DHA2_9477 [Giardia duodenalis]|uniref:GINS subunit domain-containing protein n=1 Tax=Giardia intestinalis TaxID=5741 RepID=V6TA81_GIAIN|nr:Hypothetical protein DHA2_9477 [Giardia intestinalis]